MIAKISSQKISKMTSNSVSCVACESYSQDLLSKALTKAVMLAGGFPEKVLSAKKILLKPNLLSARCPEDAVTTHPEFVRATIRELRRCGFAGAIFLGDSPAGDYSFEELWEKTGMSKIAAEENVSLLPFNNIKRLEIPGFCAVPVLRELDDFDAVINLPKLKTHMLTKITGAVKNVYGLVPGNAKSGFHGHFSSPQKMADFLAALYVRVKPSFVIMDAIESLAGNGPSNGFPFKSGLIFAGEDSLFVDACACELFDYSANDIRLLSSAAEIEELPANFADYIVKKGDEWETLKIKKAPKSSTEFLHLLPEFVFHPLSFVLNCRPTFDKELCIRCGRCERACSQGAIYKGRNEQYYINTKKCILCMCCMEACDRRAIKMQSSLAKIKKRVFDLFGLK